MYVHIVAVSGTGMGSLAGLLRELGHRVSGSDVRFDPPMGPALKDWGVELMTGFSPENLREKPDLVVIGNVCRPDNVEARAAIDGGFPYTHLAGAIQRFALDGCSPLVVTGTHGKTTTTSLCAFLLDAAERSPGLLVGGIPKDFGRGFRAAQKAPKTLSQLDGKRRQVPFVIEGDEYDTAFFEKTAKMLHYRAEVAVLTSIEHDHIDIYPTLESYLAAFERFVAALPKDGLLVANAADPWVRRVAAASAAPVSWYALDSDDTAGKPPHWLAAPVGETSDGFVFDLHVGGMKSRRLISPMMGIHNLRNAVAAIAATVEGYGARFETVTARLPAFSGVKRRQDKIFSEQGVTVYDDFAHHPSAVRETLSAIAARHVGARVIAAFEPRSATACRRLHQAEYARAFDSAQRVLLPPLGRDNLPIEERLDLDQLAHSLNARGIVTTRHESSAELAAALVAEARSGDVIVLLSNGAFEGLTQRLPADLRARSQAL